MDLEHKQEIARENGRKSHGPITPEGKHRSSLNSITHGLASKCVVLANESEEAYNALLAGYQDEWKPVTLTEQHLVIQMTNAYWRLRRIWSMETALFDTEMFCQKKGFDAAWSHHHPAMRVTDALSAIHAANAGTLETLHKYEIRYDRIHRNSANQILKLRRHRKRPLAVDAQEPSTPTLSAESPSTQPESPSEVQASARPSVKLCPLWLTRFLACILSLISPLASPRQAKVTRNRPCRASEPTILSELPVFNFYLPEIFAWLSDFTRTPPRPAFDPVPAKAEDPHENI